MAVAITATEQDVYPPRVLVSVTGLTVGDSIELFRVVGSERTLVRAGSSDSVIDPSFLVLDAELPFGVPVLYVAVVNGTAEYYSPSAPLNSNPYFETDAANWTATGGTRTWSTAQAHEGSASLLLTPDGVTAVPEVRSENVPGVVAGRTYRASPWLRCAVARSVNANIVWRDAGGVFLSSAGAVSLSVAANTWAQIEVTGVAPTSAGQAQISISMGSTPLASHLLHIDEAGLYELASAVTYTLAGGKPVITDAISGLAAEAVILAWDEKQYSRQSSVFRVGGRNVVVSDDWGQHEGTVEFFTETTSQRDNLFETLRDATEGVVQIRQPGGYDGVDAYVAVTGIGERRFSQDGTDQRRIIAVDVVEVEAWASALEAQGFTLQDIADAYTGLTLNDLYTDFPTLLDLARGVFE